jgi:hypothetical protein
MGKTALEFLISLIIKEHSQLIKGLGEEYKGNTHMTLTFSKHLHVIPAHLLSYK